jgi:hypothetical protein
VSAQRHAASAGFIGPKCTILITHVDERHPRFASDFDEVSGWIEGPYLFTTFHYLSICAQSVYQ